MDFTGIVKFMTIYVEDKKLSVLYSFDIFDTLLTRMTAVPKGIFMVMQEKLTRDIKYNMVSSYICENFAQLRIHAEEMARMHYQKGEIEDITLEQIYEALFTNGGLSISEKQMLMDLEIFTEYENIVGIKKNIQRVKELLQNKERVVLISDMYLDAAVIRTLLLKINGIFSDIEIYVSSEYKKAKHTGNLYKIVKEKENATYSNWHHLGDNAVADVAIAQQLGIEAKYVPYERFLAIEKTLLEKRPMNVFLQKYIGTARNVRLTISDEKVVEQMGASIGGPVIFAYVQWILRECINKDINRLYFIARDGYIPKKIADILISKWKLNISTHYIYGSRRAWRMPGYDGMVGGIKTIVSWSDPGSINTLNKLAKILCISAEDLADFLNVSVDLFEESLSYNALGAYVCYLDHNEAFRNFLLEKMQEERKNVKSYLMQELDISDHKFAFVDIGGSGYTQNCLANMLKEFYRHPIQTFFFKMDKISVLKQSIFYTFIPSNLQDNLVLELFSRAPHGQTEGYKKDGNGRMMPIFSDAEGEALCRYGYEMYISGVERFSKNLAETVYLQSLINIDVILQYLKNIVAFADPQVMDFLCDMPYSVSGIENRMKRFAPILTKKDIRNIYLFHTDEPLGKYYDGINFSWSRRRSSKYLNKKIDFYLKNRDKLCFRFERIMHTRLIQPSEYQNLLKGMPYFIFGKRFVLYGAGKFGRIVYKNIETAENGAVVQWLDKNHKELAKKGLHVTGSIDMIGTVFFDVLIISVLDRTIADVIRKDLCQRGVPEEKIIYLQDYNQYLKI